MSQAQYIETVESTLMEMFPEIVSTGQVTKKQLIAVKAKRSEEHTSELQSH